MGFGRWDWKPFIKSSPPRNTPSVNQFTGLTSIAAALDTCKPGQPQASPPSRCQPPCFKPAEGLPVFPTCPSFLPGPLKEGGSSGDRTRPTAPQPEPDTFLKVELLVVLPL